MPKIKFVSIATLLLSGIAQADDEPPNIVIILTDDMGYGDVHALNPASKIPTPNLDLLASQGMAFTDAHTPSAVCTPTRYGLLTGRYCWRSELKSGVLNGYDTPLIERDRPTIATFLRARGYHTAIVGKWHLGLSFAKDADGAFDFSKPVGDAPHTRGFDYSFIVPASLDFPPYVFIRDGVITEIPLLHQQAQKFPAFLREGERSPALIMEDCLDDLLDEAMGYIERRSKEPQPFFLYFPLTAPHKPTLPHPRFRGATSLGPYADFITQVDWTVGQIMKSLEENGVDNNTLLIFTSDNGSYMYTRDARPDHAEDETVQAYRPDRHRANFYFRGTKADIWEAGHRVPFFARWTGKIAAGTRNDTPICLTDFFATFAAIVDEKVPTGAAEDSYSFLALLVSPQGGEISSESGLLGESLAEPRPPIVHHSVQGMFAIRQDQWKLILGNGSGGRERPRGKPFEKPYQLFDLSKDPSEKNNAIDAFPDVAHRLEQSLLELRNR